MNYQRMWEVLKESVERLSDDEGVKHTLLLAMSVTEAIERFASAAEKADE